MQTRMLVDAMVRCPQRQAAIDVLVPRLRRLQEARLACGGGQPSEDDGDEEEEEELRVLKAGDERELRWQDSAGGALTFSTALFPPFRGYAVYPRLALANHSCVPPCAVEFSFSASLLLLAQPGVGVRAGDELAISYLDASLGASQASDPAAVARRRRLLQPYGFVCGCPACDGAASAALARLL
ncbi:unnamed protein product [Prorocentrum cordatum]|uniref:SET domain-containing protein n=1 Tax=Prorocentrum cordatum TaxID=2364126 RepID=A0ABN9T807_9DINO|nr:unnamed protein product [Polarella glacialis]